jgi:hypothetical protein
MVNNQTFRRTASRWTTRPTPELPLGIARKGDHHSSALAPQGDGRSAALDRRAGVSAVIAGAAAIVLLASVSTSAHAAEDTTRISHACAAMGLDPSELPYDDCIRSLHRTLSQLKRSERVAGNRSQCVQQGLDPGSAAFDTCVVQAELFPSGSGRNGAVASAP